MQKTCTQCSVSFEITDEDLAFYKKISPVFGGKKYLIPPPTLCPNCRQQRRLAWRNERKLYKRTCDLCNREMVSIYEQNTLFPVYCINCWWSDKWDALEYGREYTASQSFFQQYNTLQDTVPRNALYNKNSENSEYCNHSNGLRNSYLGTCVGGGSENVLYSRWIIGCYDICDCTQMMKAQSCYESLYSDCDNNCTYVYLSNECRDSDFLLDCANCSDCFQCWNLRHKQYFIQNKEYAKGEYEKYVQNIKGSWTALEKARQEFLSLVKNRAVYKHLRMENCIDSVGDFLMNCKNVTESFDVFDSEDCKYCYASESLKDCYDVNEAAFNCELQCDSQSCDSCVRVHFSHTSYDNHDCLYVDSCYNSSNLFGCIGLKRNEYCILNKQYSKEDYEELVPKIIEHMNSAGEWGAFFPVRLSPVAYNETIANDYFPLTKAEVLMKRWKWKKMSNNVPYVSNTITASQLPDRIGDIPDDILNWAIICARSKKPFKIVKQELDFYRRMNLPVPHLHPEERYRERMAITNPRKITERECNGCGKKVKTTYAPERPETVYCESCYLELIY